jgi:hypothetical protein
MRHQEQSMLDATQMKRPSDKRPLGPIQPGSPLYRALEMVAREIVKAIEADAVRGNFGNGTQIPLDKVP